MEIYNPNKQSEVIKKRREINGQWDRVGHLAAYALWKASPFILTGRLLQYSDQDRPLLHNLAAAGSAVLAWGIISLVQIYNEAHARDSGFDVDIYWSEKQAAVTRFFLSRISR